MTPPPSARSWPRTLNTTLTSGLLALLLTAAIPGEAAESGIFVWRLVDYGAADQAGIPEQALLRRWSVGDGMPSTFDSWIDVRLLELERSFLGPIDLHGSVGGQQTTWSLALPSWGLVVAPEIDGLEEPDNLDEIEGLLEGSDIDDESRIWLHLRRAELLEQGAESLAADVAFAEALSVSARLGGSASAVIADERGNFLFDQQQYSRARQAYRAALDQVEEDSLIAVHLVGMAIRQLFYSGEITQARSELEALLPRILLVAPNSLVQARYQSWLAQIYGLYGEVEQEEALLKEALGLQRELGPHDHAALAQLLDARGDIAKKKGQWDDAIRFTREAVDLGIAHRPESAGTATLLNNLGHLFISLGDLEEGEVWMSRSLELYRRVSPGLDEITPLANLALIALERGRLAEAEALAQQSVRLLDELDAGNYWFSAGHRVLSEVARRRGDLETARIHSDRAVQSVLEEVDGGELAAEEFTWHANLLRQQGEVAAARDLVAKTMAEQPPTEGPREVDAAQLTLLGHLELELGNETRAGELWRQALGIYRAMVPRGARTAAAWARLAGLAMRRGQPDEAETSIQAGLEIATAVSSGTLVEAELWSLRGQLEEERSQSSEALVSYCKARDAAEQQREVVGGTDLEQSYFAERLQSYYRDCLRLHAEKGNAEAAFVAFEQSRGRVLRSLLNKRSANWETELSSDLREQLHRARRGVAAARLRLGGLESDSEKLPVARAELEAARSQLAEVEHRALQEAPRRALGPQSPNVSLQESLVAIPRGSLFIGYSVGEASTWALVAKAMPAGGQPTLHLRHLEIGQTDLRKLTTDFLAGLDLANRVPIDELNRTGQRLYSLLIEPLEDLLPADAEILLSPDVPLLELPFAALVRSGPLAGHGPTYLIEDHPIRYVDSLSILSLRSTPESPPPRDGIVLGLAAPTGHEPSALQALGIRDIALPGARQEIEALGLQYAKGERTRTLIGKAASESELYRLAPSARILHFATHGVYDAAYPLASWLLLSPGGGEDGKLEAWEIVERLRTKAELATLSACESARGQPFAGEGLLGMARALHIAGASSVLASSWRIGDRSTADLMGHFYRLLSEGDNTAEALRRAQVGILRRGGQRARDKNQRGVGGLVPTKSAVHPFYWAAFRLSGPP